MCRELLNLVEGGIGEKEGTLIRNNTYQLKLWVPPILSCGIYIGGRWVVKLCYLS